MGPLLGRFEFDLAGRTAYAYIAGRAARLSCCSRAASCIRRSASRCRRCATTGCAPTAIGMSVHARLVGDLHLAGGVGRRRRRAAGADHRLRLARRVRLPPQRRRAAGAGDRRHRLALRRHLRRHRLQAAARRARRPGRRSTGHFWIGLFLVVLVLVGRDRLLRPWTWFGSAAERAHERRPCSRRAGLVKRFGGITATNDVSLDAASAARATR